MLGGPYFMGALLRHSRRYGLALWAVLAFSFGLAVVLILIMACRWVWGVEPAPKAFRGKRWFGLVSKWLPIMGAALVVVIGVWLMRVNLPK